MVGNGSTAAGATRVEEGKDIQQKFKVRLRLAPAGGGTVASVRQTKPSGVDNMSIRFAILLKKHARLLILAAVVALPFPRTAVAQSGSAVQGMTGTWLVQVSAISCSTGQPVGPSFSSLLTFGVGGTLTGTTSNPGFQPGQRTSDFGVWKKTGSNAYSADSEAFILFTSSAPPVFQAGRQRIIQSITLTGDSFDSVAVTRFYDTVGNLVNSGCAHASATRYE